MLSFRTVTGSWLGLNNGWAQVSIASVLLFCPRVFFLSVPSLTKPSLVIQATRQVERLLGLDAAAPVLARTEKIDAVETRIRSVRSLEGSRPANSHRGRKQRREKGKRMTSSELGTAQMALVSTALPELDPQIHFTFP